MPVNLAVGDTVLLKGKVTDIDSKAISVYIEKAQNPTPIIKDASTDGGGVTLDLPSADISHEPVIIIVD